MEGLATATIVTAPSAVTIAGEFGAAMAFGVVVDLIKIVVFARARLS